MGERTIFAASTIFASCSSAVPCALSNIAGRRADRAHADLEVELQLVGAGADASQVVGLERAEEADLAEVDDLDVPLRREVQLLERRPVLRAQAVHVDAEAHGRRGLGVRDRSPEHDRRGADGLQKASAVDGLLRTSVGHHRHLRRGLMRKASGVVIPRILSRFQGSILLPPEFFSWRFHRFGRPEVGHQIDHLAVGQRVEQTRGHHRDGRRFARLDVRLVDDRGVRPTTRSVICLGRSRRRRFRQNVRPSRVVTTTIL